LNGPKSCHLFVPLIILDSAVVTTHLTQAIDSPGVSGESLITNKVTAISPDTPDKSISYAMHAPPTAESKIITRLKAIFQAIFKLLVVYVQLIYACLLLCDIW
jgi:hypothetical protein